MSRPAVFVSSSVEGLPIARELARQLESIAEPLIWTESAFYPGKTVAESLTETVDRCEFAIVVLGTARGPSERPSSPMRSNLLFELGFLSGRLGLERILIVDSDGMEIPSDLTGVTYLRVPKVQYAEIATAVAPAVAAIANVISTLAVRESRTPDRSVSYFISYAWDDKEFSARLHRDLLQVGVRSWLDVKEIKVGQRLWEQIERGIQASDRVLLILSEASIHSAWVKYEIRQALALEAARRKSVLFPIRLDNAVFDPSSAEEILRVREKYIADFSGWREQHQYRRAFSSLVRDLAITASSESERTV